MSTSRPNLYKRITASVPLLVTVIVHIVLIAVAGYFVSEKIINRPRPFEATVSSDSAADQKLENKLRTARQPAGSASTSPVELSRIVSTAENALQMPVMPDLNTEGASSLAGTGFDKNMGVANTALSDVTTTINSDALGRGFMPLTFIGVTNPRTNKVAFVVDISPSLMDIRKGGFRAFEILRQEISRLVSTLPPATAFNVVLFDGNSVRLFASELQPSTVANKTEFIEWIKPINADLASIGGRSIPSASPRWNYRPDESLKLDPEYGPAAWVQAIHAALEQKPDTLFVITGSGASGQIRISEESIARRQREREREIAELKRQGYDFDAINAARSKAMAALRAEFNEINRKLVAQNKDPFVVTDIRRVLEPDFQTALRRAGFPPLKLDTTGWADKQGKPIWTNFSNHVGKTRNAEFSDVISHVSKLQYGLLRGNAALNIFLFTGPDEKVETSERNLSALASRNSGAFRLLTTKRLEEFARREASVQ